MIHKLSNVNFEIFFEFDTNRSTRGHSLKLKKKRFNTELRQHFFTDRITNLWNSLDEQIVIYVVELFQEWTWTTAEATQTDGSCTVKFWLLISWGWAPFWWGLDLVSYVFAGESESSRKRKFHSWNFSSRERMVLGAKVQFPFANYQTMGASREKLDKNI